MLWLGVRGEWPSCNSESRLLACMGPPSFDSTHSPPTVQDSVTELLSFDLQPNQEMAIVMVRIHSTYIRTGEGKPLAFWPPPPSLPPQSPPNPQNTVQLQYSTKVQYIYLTSLTVSDKKFSILCWMKGSLSIALMEGLSRGWCFRHESTKERRSREYLIATDG